MAKAALRSPDRPGTTRLLEGVRQSYAAGRCAYPRVPTVLAACGPGSGRGP